MLSISKVTFIFILTLLVGIYSWSCTTSNFTKTTNQISPKIPLNQPIYYYVYEDLPADTIKLGEFYYKDAMTTDWEYVKEKTDKIARDNGANLIKVNYYILNSSIYPTEIFGDLYRVENSEYLAEYTKSVQTERLKDSNFSIIYIIRNEAQALLRGLFDVEIYMDNKFIDKIGANDLKMIRIEKNQKINLSPGKNSYGTNINIELGKIYYVYVTQEMGTSNRGGGFSLNVGPQNFILLDYDYGRLMMLRIKNFLKWNK